MSASENAKSASLKLLEKNVELVKRLEQMDMSTPVNEIMDTSTAELLLVVNSAEEHMGLASAERIMEIESAETPVDIALIEGFINSNSDPDRVATLASAELRVAMAIAEDLA